MDAPIFALALTEMGALSSNVYGPSSFRSYVTRAGGQARNTASCISVDSLGQLARELFDAGVMVFRLGSPNGERYTHFALARTIAGWSDYFFIDEEIFASNPSKTFCHIRDREVLRVFSLLPKFTETSSVNLAFASGLFPFALSLDETDLPLVPATGQGTYSFPVTPNRKFEVTWQHVRGQLEIDGVFIAIRGGRKTLFVVEAKASNGLKSLAKHKLAYPMLALRATLEADYDVVGIYLRTIRRSDQIIFYLAECQFEPGHSDIASLRARSIGSHAITCS